MKNLNNSNNINDYLVLTKKVKSLINIDMLNKVTSVNIDEIKSRLIDHPEFEDLFQLAKNRYVDITINDLENLIEDDTKGLVSSSVITINNILSPTIQEFENVEIDQEIKYSLIIAVGLLELNLLIGYIKKTKFKDLVKEIAEETAEEIINNPFKITFKVQKGVVDIIRVKASNFIQHALKNNKISEHCSLLCAVLTYIPIEDENKLIVMSLLIEKEQPEIEFNYCLN